MIRLWMLTIIATICMSFGARAGEAQAAGSDNLRVSYDNEYYPYLYYDKYENEYRGICLDLLGEAFPNSELIIKHKTESAVQLNEQLLQGELDLVFFSSTGLNDSQLSYSQPLQQNSCYLITKDNDDAKDRDPNTSKIGVSNGSAAAAELHSIFPNADIRIYNDVSGLLYALSLGVIDFAVQTEGIYDYYYYQNEFFNLSKVRPLPIQEYTCFALSDSPGNQDLLDYINKSIESVPNIIDDSAYPDVMNVIIQRYTHDRTRNRYIIVIVTLLFLTTVFLAAMYLHEKENNQVLDGELQMYETAFLQAQIKPHFLYNALGRIMSMCYVNGEQAGLLLGNLTRYLRIIYHTDNNDKYIPISRELELIESYVKIEVARFGDKIRVEYDIDPDCTECWILPMIIQPLVENAIRHGISKKAMGGLVRVQIQQNNLFLVIKVIDDGVGISEQTQKTLFLDRIRGKGIGIANVYKRISAFGHGASISVRSELEKGTEITVTFPIIEPAPGEVNYEYA